MIASGLDRVQSSAFLTALLVTTLLVGSVDRRARRA
jgi:hypothetical protein